MYGTYEYVVLHEQVRGEPFETQHARTLPLAFSCSDEGLARSEQCWQKVAVAAKGERECSAGRGFGDGFPGPTWINENTELFPDVYVVKKYFIVLPQESMRLGAFNQIQSICTYFSTQLNWLEPPSKDWTGKQSKGQCQGRLVGHLETKFNRFYKVFVPSINWGSVWPFLVCLIFVWPAGAKALASSTSGRLATLKATWKTKKKKKPNWVVVWKASSTFESQLRLKEGVWRGKKWQN